MYQVPVICPNNKKVRLRSANNGSLLKTNQSLLKPGQSLLKNPPKRKHDQSVHFYQNGGFLEKQNGDICEPVLKSKFVSLSSPVTLVPLHSNLDGKYRSEEVINVDKSARNDYYPPPGIENELFDDEFSSGFKNKVYLSNINLEYSLEVEI